MTAIRDIRAGLWHLRRGGLAQFATWRSRRRTELGFAAPRNVQGVEADWTGRGRRKRLSLAPAALPAPQPSRPEVRAAVILDDFSALAFGYEWATNAVHPHTWRSDLAAGDVDLLFVESAWAGNGGLWRGKLAGPTGPSSEFRELVQWCRAQGIPTVFWNKEDPPHYDDFLPAAQLIDQVFTSDSGRLPQYRLDLGHERVSVLPFAAQPAVHNPVRPAHGWHSRDVAFAGMYFAHKYPERRAQMDFLLGGALDASAKMGTGLEIFSRQLGGNADYQFPAPLDSRVVGSLTYPQTLSAYKAYKVFLNVNSVTESRSMCSRRLFELSAAETAIISAPAASIEPFFGDTITVVENAEQTTEALARLLGDDDARDRQALRAHRRVFDEHLYSHRVATVLRSVGLASAEATVPKVSAIVPTVRPEQVDHVLATIAHQSHPAVELVLVTHGFVLDEPELRRRAEAAGVTDLVLVSADAGLTLGAILNLGIEASSGDLVAKMDDDNFYGEHYLTDLVRALEFARADVVGKWAHYVLLESTGETLLRFAHAEHRYVPQVQGGTLLMGRSLAEEFRFDDLPRGVDTAFLARVIEAGRKVYAADRFNFVSVRRANPESHTWTISDDEIRARSSQVVDTTNPYALAEV
jgi:spore maturation protein CgeB